ncbi:MAG: arginine N-succinyltransferase [Bradymonadia bacterium]|jgi:arginine N-succinyltransferase
MFIVREARPDDLTQLAQIAVHLNTVNLPADEVVLADLIRRSVRSFANADLQDKTGHFLFVLEELATQRVAGVSMIISSHGTVEDPHHYLLVDVDERHSPAVGKVFRHQTLQFRRSLTPHTEIGALILSPEFRGHPSKLGKLLSFARFQFIAANPDRFQDSVQAELLPPFGDDGSSLLWEWLGRRFTDLDYDEADRLSSSDHEFVRDLFPRAPIYTAVMPRDVQEVIGAIGKPTLGVAAMLKRIGFRYNQHIDPFDGGPHFECRTEEISIVADTQTRIASSEPCALDEPLALIGRRRREDHPFRCTIVSHRIAEGRVQLPDATRTALDIAPGELVMVTPLLPSLKRSA